MALPPSIRHRMASNKGAPVASLTPTAKRDGRPLEHPLPSTPPRVSTASEKSDFSDMVGSSPAGDLLSEPKRPLYEILSTAPFDPNPRVLDDIAKDIGKWAYIADRFGGIGPWQVTLFNGETAIADKLSIQPETWGIDLEFDSGLCFFLGARKVAGLVHIER